MNPGSSDNSSQKHDQFSEDYDGPVATGHMHWAIQALCLMSFPMVVVLYALHQLLNIGRKPPRFEDEKPASLGPSGRKPKSGKSRSRPM